MTALTATATDSATATVSWTPGTGSVQSSFLLRYKGRTQATDWTTADPVSGQSKSVTGLFPDDTYTFGVKAVSGGQTSTEVTTTAVICK